MGNGKAGKAKMRARKAFPLRGRCRTDVRRMRWGANHCYYVNGEGDTAPKRHLSLPETDGKGEMPPHQSLSRQLPLKGKPGCRAGKAFSLRRMRWGAHPRRNLNCEGNTAPKAAFAIAMN